MTENADRHPSNDPPMEPETFDRGNPLRRCTAKLSDGSGDRCRNWAIKGGTVCRYHGGAVKKTIDRARRRLAENADRGAKQLLKLAFDEKQSAEIRLKATLQLLDRAGVNARTSVDIEVSQKPYEQVLEGIANQLEITSRDAYRRSVGTDSNDADSPDADPLAQLRARDLATATRDDDGVIDALVVDVSESGSRSYPSAHDDDDWPASERTPGETAPSRPGGLMSVTDLVEQQGSDVRRARVHPMQRALPPGRSS